jgi:hypothetical protein
VKICYPIIILPHPQAFLFWMRGAQGIMVSPVPIAARIENKAPRDDADDLLLFIISMLLN